MDDGIDVVGGIVAGELLVAGSVAAMAGRKTVNMEALYREFEKLAEVLRGFHENRTPNGQTAVEIALQRDEFVSGPPLLIFDAFCGLPIATPYGGLEPT